MADEKKTPEEEKAENKPKEEQAETPKADEKPPEEKPTEAAEGEEKAEGETVSDEPEKPTENPTEGETEPESAPPELSEEDKLREENFRLKTQLEAMKIGFIPDVIEDAVILAENIVKRDGSDISAALQAVAKKYPDWKADGKDKGKSKGGFKVGADSSGQTKANDEKIDRAFGLRKRG